MVINVYEQYFKAEGTFNGVERKGALVMLISDSEAGNISCPTQSVQRQFYKSRLALVFLPLYPNPHRAATIIFQRSIPDSIFPGALL